VNHFHVPISLPSTQSVCAPSSKPFLIGFLINRVSHQSIQYPCLQHTFLPHRVPIMEGGKRQSSKNNSTVRRRRFSIMDAQKPANKLTRTKSSNHSAHHVPLQDYRGHLLPRSPKESIRPGFLSGSPTDIQFYLLVKKIRKVDAKLATIGLRFIVSLQWTAPVSVGGCWGCWGCWVCVFFFDHPCFAQTLCLLLSFCLVSIGLVRTQRRPGKFVGPHRHISQQREIDPPIKHTNLLPQRRSH
jgi:hypothetical protein